MKKAVFLFLFLVLYLLTACDHPAAQPEPSTVPSTCVYETLPVTESTIPSTLPPEPETTAAPTEPVVLLTEEEQSMLLKIGMAERGDTECTECIALVMRTVLNRVESGRFGKSIQTVLFAPEQFTPVMDGTYASAEPNEACREALNMVISGWDESQGALFYEWCEGESWHSKNLHLLFQHCDTRFYD